MGAPQQDIPMQKPVLLDTDIGTDIDDAYALLLAATSPEISLLGVSTVNNDTVLRARIARKLLNLLGRTEVPVIAGFSNTISGISPPGWMGHEGEGLDLSGPSLHPNTIALNELYFQALRKSEAAGHRLTIITIGALTNIAWLLDQMRSVDTKRVERIIAMASTWNGYGEEAARCEHNGRCDPEAFDKVLQRGIPLTIVGLNVTQSTAMTDIQLGELEAIGGPLAVALSGMHRVWFDVVHKRSSPMHDALAVAAAFEPRLVTTIPVTGRTTGSDGTVTYNRPASEQVTHTEIATDLDVRSFEGLFWNRTLGAVHKSRRLLMTAD
jgi:purine nucleosidase